MVEAIKRLVIRGAPALGVAGAPLVALAARSRAAGQVRHDAAVLRAARPTAVKLALGVDRALARLADGPDAVLAEALDVLAEEVRRNRALGVPGPPGCSAGASPRWPCRRTVTRGR